MPSAESCGSSSLVIRAGDVDMTFFELLCHLLKTAIEAAMVLVAEEQ